MILATTFTLIKAGPGGAFVLRPRESFYHLQGFAEFAMLFAIRIHLLVRSVWISSP